MEAMLAQGDTLPVRLGGGTETSTFPRLTEGNDLIRIPSETVVVADDEELHEDSHTPPIRILVS